MKDQNRFSITILLTGMILLLFALGQMANRFPVEATPPADDLEIFGMTGIIADQTLRLNVVNTARNGQSKTRTLKFVDTSGNTIINTSGQLVETTVTLAPGESAFLDLNGSDIPGIGSGSVLVRGVDPTCPRCGGPNTVIQSLEMIDNPSDRTTYYYSPPDPITPPDPIRFISFGMIGLADGQTARLNVVQPDGPPQRVVFGFIKSNGQPVLNADGFPFQMDAMLAAGQSASFDLPAGAILSAGETRAQFRALVVIPEGPPVRLISTLELRDAAGKTHVLAQPAITHRACR